MTNKMESTKQICPLLGLQKDRASHFSYPENGHLCFASTKGEGVDLTHQKQFCFGDDFTLCARYVDPTTLPMLPTDDETPEAASKTWMYVGVGGVIGLVLVMIIFLSGTTPDTPQTNFVVPIVASEATATATITPVSVAVSTPTIPLLGTPTQTIKDSEGRVYSLSSPAASIGWVVSSEARGNHFGDSYLYAGILDGNVYLGGLQFDLSNIPRGAPIYDAEIQIVGLRENLLDMASDATWKLHWLDSEIDQNFRNSNYQTLLNTNVFQTFNPLMGVSDLGMGLKNQFVFSPDQRQMLEEKIIQEPSSKLSLRIDGALSGDDNLFAWDTGYGSKSRTQKAILTLNVGQAPATPPPYAYILVTSTPQPENVMTAAAVAATVTADATRIGTATPLPLNMVTATAIPDYLVIVPTPTPGNNTTATAQSAVSTAMALTTGTATLMPVGAVTATPMPTPSITHTPTPANFVIITSTPTPDSIFVAATQSARLTAQATRIGTPTPLPPNWVTPVVSTATPVPLNAATAQAQRALATAMALTTGTPTPTPANQILATSTPVFEELSLLPTETPTLSPDYIRPIPASLQDKILFHSDREGNRDMVYVYDPQTGTLGRLTETWPYAVAQERDTYSADKRLKAITKPSEASADGRLQIHLRDMILQQEYVLTQFGSGISYDPALSPTNNRVAFATTEGLDDEVWVINNDGTGGLQLTNNTWESDKSPSWSPDGTQIVFESNRTGSSQLWIMNADGSEQQLLFGNQTDYNDTAPVWVKFLDPAP